MNHQRVSLAPGLYLVATPIGNARDITLRALDVLASADVLVAEDTRTLLKLMTIHGIALDGRKALSFHDHSKPKDRARIMAALEAGQSVAYATDAGTPLIADPGYTLVTEARAATHLVTSAPGPSALVTALSIAGLATDRFSFHGFAPAAQSARKEFLAEIGRLPQTTAFYEAPSRIEKCLGDAIDVLGGERHAVLCRELTKRFEEVASGSLADLAGGFAEKAPRGEYVVLLAKPGETATEEADIDAALKAALTTMRVKDAAEAVSGSLGLPKRNVYQRALHLKASEQE